MIHIEVSKIELNFKLFKKMLGRLSFVFFSTAVNPGISQLKEKITFTWEISERPVSEYHTDRSMLVIYFPDIKETCCQLIGARRVEGKDVVIIGAEHVNQRMEAYITFIKDNGKAVSNSVYAGSLNTINAIITDISITDQKYDIKHNMSTTTDESGACDYYIIKDKMTQKPISNCVLRHNQDNFQIVEIGIKISPTAQSEETTSTIMSYIFVRKE
jgi:hypothetical protein